MSKKKLKRYLRAVRLDDEERKKYLGSMENGHLVLGSKILFITK